MTLREKSYKFRIYPNKRQEILIQKTFGCSRYVYNYYLSKRIDLFKTHNCGMNYYDCSRDLTNLKQENLWLKEPDKWALQTSLIDLNNAYENYFRKIKNGDKQVGFPKFN